mgnify:CR=1 FL=1
MKRFSVFLTVLLLILCFVIPCGALSISEKSMQQNVAAPL